jgi:hypothetical protein
MADDNKIEVVIPAQLSKESLDKLMKATSVAALRSCMTAIAKAFRSYADTLEAAPIEASSAESRDGAEQAIRKVVKEMRAYADAAEAQAEKI